MRPSVYADDQPCSHRKVKLRQPMSFKKKIPAECNLSIKEVGKSTVIETRLSCSFSIHLTLDTASCQAP